ncbi:hypothetical protein ABEB36_010306 [Hypothenemus hampei]|uniref:Uncharacterized protein n=1 Tax=Hypothenemus hampei TaxID=57062 RepID=A0ABD1EJ81_HYPHA
MFSEDIPNSTQNIDGALLNQALFLTEVAIDLRERYTFIVKYSNYLKTMINGAEKAATALQFTSKESLSLAQKLLQAKSDTLHLKHEYDNLQSVINRELNNLEVMPEVNTDMMLNIDQLSEKIRFLESKNRNFIDNNIQVNSASSRSSKIDINEKYPENLSRESLIDLNNVINLPPVPEDIFTSFSNNKPIRSSSLSSLKSMRKVKLFLQKAESSEDDDSSDNDDTDFSRVVYGDSDDNKALSCHSPSSKKLHLGNIKEETQD